MQVEHFKFLENILKYFEPQPMEIVHLPSSLGRILAVDLRAKHTSPYKDISAIHGYAVSSAHSDAVPQTFKLIGESTASRPFTEELTHGQAVEVFSGSVLPIGSDAVLSLEEADKKENSIIVKQAIIKGQNVCYTGVDFIKNEPVLKAGKVISAKDIGLAAAMAITWIPVIRKPQIAFFAIGDELAMLGDISESTKTASSSSLMIAAFIEACGAVPINLGIAKDNDISILRTLESAKGADLIVTSGGVSASSDGLLKKLLDKKSKKNEINIELSHKTTILLGEKNGIQVLALPGHPISAQICATLFLRPVIHKMTDMRQKVFKKGHALLDRDLDINDKKMDYIFSRLEEGEDKHLRVMPASSYDRVLMSALAHSDCLITVDPQKSKKGDSVCITRFLCSVISG